MNVTNNIAKAAIQCAVNNTQDNKSVANSRVKDLTDALIKNADLLTNSSKFLNAVWSNPTGVFCGMVLLAQGGVKVIGLNPMGVLDVLIGARQVCNEMNRYANLGDGIQQVLGNIDGAFDALEGLNARGKENLQKLGANIEAIEGNCKKLEAKLNSIKALAEYGEKAVQEEKAMVEQALKQSQDQLEAAKKLFKKALAQQKAVAGLVEQSKQNYDRIKELSSSAYTTLEAANVAKEEVFKLSKVGAELSAEIIDMVNESEELIQQGIEKMTQGQSSQMEAFDAVAKLEGLVKGVAEKIKLEAAHKEERLALENQILEAKKLVDENMELLNAKSEIVNEGHAQVEDAKNMAATMWTRTEVALTLLPMLFLPGSILVRAAVAVLVNQIYKHRDTIMKWVIPVPEKPQAQVMGPLEFNFDNYSTGLGGRLIRRSASHTEGTIKIDLGNGETFECRVNFNNKYGAITSGDLAKLSKKLIAGLNDGSISTKQAQEILKALSEMEINRGKLHPDAKGFAKSGHAALKAVEQKIRMQPKVVDLSLETEEEFFEIEEAADEEVFYEVEGSEEEEFFDAEGELEEEFEDATSQLMGRAKEYASQLIAKTQYLETESTFVDSKVIEDLLSSVHKSSQSLSEDDFVMIRKEHKLDEVKASESSSIEEDWVDMGESAPVQNKMGAFTIIEDYSPSQAVKA